MKSKEQNIVLKIVQTLMPAIFIVSNIFLFGPFTIYEGNVGEFHLPFITILKQFLYPSLIFIFLVCFIGLFLNDRLYKCYVSVLFVIGLLIWVQGNIIVWKYGLLDGQKFDWAENRWRGFFDGAFWCIFLIMGIIFYKRIYRIAIFICIAFFCLQLIFLTIKGVQHTEIWKTNSTAFHSMSAPPEEIFEFSPEKNVIHIILDAFQSDIFHEIISENPDYYYKALNGFTFFKEAISTFPTTYMSIPAILAGKNYKNDIPMPEFVESVLKSKTITNTAYNNGYDVDYLGAKANLYAKGHFSNAYQVSVPYGKLKDQYEKNSSAMILDMTLFRHAPHFLKKIIYNDQLWLVQNLLKQEGHTRFQFFAYKAFFQELIDNMTIMRKRPVYKYIHLMHPHAPFVVKQNGDYAGKVLDPTRENAKNQSKQALDQFITFLKKLKALNIYESSLIILHADHGGHVPVRNADQKDYNSIELGLVIKTAVSLMAIKLPYSDDAFKISNSQVSLTDIPATISSILKFNENFPGRSMLEIDPNENRERRFYHYEFLRKHWQGQYFDRIDEYIVKGKTFDISSWRKGQIYHRPGSLYITNKLDFGTPEAPRYLRSGWCGNEKHPKDGYTLNWAKGSSASLFLSLPKKETVIMTANITSLPFDPPQHVTIKVDEKEIGSWIMPAKWGLDKYTVRIEPDKNRLDVSIVEFIFSQHLEEDRKRQLAVLFESITLSEAIP